MKKRMIIVSIIILMICSLFQLTNIVKADTTGGTQTISDGTYKIESALNNNYVLDISAGSTTDGAKLQIWTNGGVNQQKFTVKYLGNGYYSITSVNSGKVLEVQGGLKTNSTRVQQYTSNGTDAQKWVIKDAGNGYFYIVSKLGDLCLNVIDGSASNGSGIEVYQGSNWTSQKFKFVATSATQPTQPTQPTGTQTVSDGTYAIQTALSDKYVLDISQGSTADRARLQIWTNGGVNQQKFTVKYLGNGYYTITSVNSGKVLDVEGGAGTNSTRVQQFTSNSTDAQKWVIKDAGNGYFYIVSKLGDFALNVIDGNASNGAGIEIYQSSNWTSQKFKFVATSETQPTQPAQPTGTQTVSDGTYAIQTALSDKYVLDISQGSTADRAKLQIWTNGGVNQQKFTVKYLGNGYYTITSVNSGKVLDVEGGAGANSTRVQQFTSNSTDAQKWVIKDAGDGYYYIISKLGDFALNVIDGSATNGAGIEIYQSSNWTSQKFKFVDASQSQPIGTQTISDGTYAIRTAINSNYVLDISQGSTADGANAQLWNWGYVNQQIYTIKYLGNGCYSIICTNSNKALDVAGGKAANSTKVDQFTSNNTDAQQWIIKDAGDGYYYIVSKLGNLYLNVVNGSASNGQGIEVYQGNNWTSQKFKFEYFKPVQSTVANGIYTIESALDTNYVLDVSQASLANGANIQLWTNGNVPQQAFQINDMGGGYYRITCINSNKSLDVAGGGVTPGTNVQQYDVNGTSAQTWIISDAGDGYYNIISRCNGLYLDVQNAAAADGTNIQVYTNNGNTAQKFKFEKSKITDVNIDTTKYPGYKEKIEALIAKHPQWQFRFLYTGVNFNDAVNGEASVADRNLVPPSYTGEWLADTTSYDSGWYPASAKAIAYYLDPRNFLDDVNVFQFEDVNSYPSAATLSGIQTKVNDTYLSNYANDINTACYNKNVNPYYIISRLIQEQGSKGTKIGTGMDGGDGQTYYDPFDIGASGNGYDEIYANALATAKSYGWNTMEKAIEGGITFCKENWLDNYQNTLYQNRFDIDSTNGTSLYTHQYMQNLMGAYSEARILESTYSNIGQLDSNFVFVIPVYEGMDSNPSPMPSSSGSTGSGITTINEYPQDVSTGSHTGVNIRQSATTGSTAVLNIANSGTELLSVKRVQSSDGYEWQQVITTDGTNGYIRSDFLTNIDNKDSLNIPATVKTSSGGGCWYRIGPSTSLDAIQCLPDGTQVTIKDKDRYNIGGYNWYRIEYNGKEGFMPSQYLVS